MARSAMTATMSPKANRRRRQFFALGDLLPFFTLRCAFVVKPGGTVGPGKVNGQRLYLALLFLPAAYPSWICDGHAKDFNDLGILGVLERGPDRSEGQSRSKEDQTTVTIAIRLWRWLCFRGSARTLPIGIVLTYPAWALVNAQGRSAEVLRNPALGCLFWYAIIQSATSSPWRRNPFGHLGFLVHPAWLNTVR